MDLATKEKFKWKFYRLAALLNIIILLVGIGILSLFWMPESLPYSHRSYHWSSGYRIDLVFLGSIQEKPGNGWTIRSKWSINEQTVLQVRGNNDLKKVKSEIEPDAAAYRSYADCC